MILERFCYSPQGTFGKLIVEDFQCYTVERPWLDNQPSISCIPEGLYELEEHSSSKYPDTYALIGATVSHWPGEGKRRSTVLFHAGNTQSDLQGCIAPGMKLGVLGSQWAVLQSSEAMHGLVGAIQDTSKRLSITHYDPFSEVRL